MITCIKFISIPIIVSTTKEVSDLSEMIDLGSTPVNTNKGIDLGAYLVFSFYDSADGPLLINTVSENTY